MTCFPSAVTLPWGGLTKSERVIYLPGMGAGSGVGRVGGSLEYLGVYSHFPFSEGMCMSFADLTPRHSTPRSTFTVLPTSSLYVNINKHI